MSTFFCVQFHLGRCLKEKEPLLDEFARCFGQLLRTNGWSESSSPANARNGKILVCFIGGVTVAECAALDLLSRQLGRNILVAATDTTSGPAFIDSVAKS